MDGSRFDAISRKVATSVSRRGAIGYLSAITASIAGIVHNSEATLSARQSTPIAADATPTVPEVIAPKVLTIAMFQTGDPLGDGSGEASVWVQNDNLTNLVPIPGSYSPLYCNDSFDHCLVITGVMAANAAATVMAVGLSERVDLSNSYVMVAGIGGGPPEKVTIGTAAWADWIVSGDLVTELDAREMPDDWQYPKASLGCAQQWCEDGFRTGTEVFQLDPAMTG